MLCRDLAQFLLWICDAFDPFPRGVECFCNVAIEDRMKNVFLALEVEIDRAVGYAGFARDVGDFGIEVAVVCEDTGSGAQNCFTLICI